MKNKERTLSPMQDGGEDFESYESEDFESYER